MNEATTPTRADLGDVRAFITAERERIAGDESYTPGERLRLAVAFDLMLSSRPTARIKGLEVYERVEAARPGARSLAPPLTVYEHARRLQAQRLAEWRRERDADQSK